VELREGKGRSNVKVADCSLPRHSRRRIGVAEELGGASGRGHQGQRPEGRTAPSEEASHRAGSEPGSEFVPGHLPPAVKVSVDSAPPAVIEFVRAKSVRRRRLRVLGWLLGGIGIGAMGVLLLPGGREAVKVPRLPPVLNQPVLGLPTAQARGAAQTPARRASGQSRSLQHRADDDTAGSPYAASPVPESGTDGDADAGTQPNGDAHPDAHPHSPTQTPTALTASRSLLVQHLPELSGADPPSSPACLPVGDPCPPR